MKYGLWDNKGRMLTSSRTGNKGEQMMRRYGFYIMAAALVLFIFSMMTMTVNATEDKKLQHQNAYYEEMEDTYVASLRSELAAKGYRNAGITMTKIFYENGEREYTVKIHHKRMEQLSSEEQGILLEELSMTNFTDSECRICLTLI